MWILINDLTTTYELTLHLSVPFLEPRRQSGEERVVFGLELAILPQTLVLHTGSLKPPVLTDPEFVLPRTPRLFTVIAHNDTSNFVTNAPEKLASADDELSPFDPLRELLVDLAKADLLVFWFRFLQALNYETPNY